ncbi:MAG: hypothetical protein QW434_04245 [Pyrobaculum sp.]
MQRYIMTSLALYAASFAAGIAGVSLLSALLSIGALFLIAVFLMKAHSLLIALKNKFWDKLSGVWLGGEYSAALWLFLLSGIGSEALLAIISSQFESIAALFPIDAAQGDVISQEVLNKAFALAALSLGLAALAAVGLAAWAYLIEVFTRDVYLIKVATGVGEFRPYSATFYILLSLITLGFLYYFWLYSLWRWISQLTSSTK